MKDINLLSGHLPGFILEYRDKKGIISKISSILAENDINIANIRVDRVGEIATMICELDSSLDKATIVQLSDFEELISARFYDPDEERER
ncbi:MAG: ACT domain-containing protein [Gudongella sp.]|jgi:L-serine dehydratase|nr:ACT domain-containing protein [Gudongella sp.]